MSLFLFIYIYILRSIYSRVFIFFLFVLFLLSFVLSSVSHVSGLLACVCCARRTQYDGMALRCLLSSLQNIAFSSLGATRAVGVPSAAHCSLFDIGCCLVLLCWVPSVRGVSPSCSTHARGCWNVHRQGRRPGCRPSINSCRTGTAYSLRTPFFRCHVDGVGGVFHQDFTEPSSQKNTGIISNAFMSCWCVWEGCLPSANQENTGLHHRLATAGSLHRLSNTSRHMPFY